MIDDSLAEIRKRLDAECPHPRGSEAWKVWWQEFHEAAADMLNDDAANWPHDWP